MLLWKRAYPDTDHETTVDELFGSEHQGLGMHLLRTPILNKDEVAYDAEYTYKRSETLKYLLNQDEKREQGQEARILKKLEKSNVN